MSQLEREKWLAHLKALEGLLDNIDEYSKASGYDREMHEKFLNAVLDRYFRIIKKVKENGTD